MKRGQKFVRKEILKILSSEPEKYFLEIPKTFELDMPYTVFRGVEHDAIG